MLVLVLVLVQQHSRGYTWKHGMSFSAMFAGSVSCAFMSTAA